MSKTGSFAGQHVMTPLKGVVLHINAFNFPVWGMLEKLAVNLLAGVPAIVKPASQTAYLTEAVFRDMVASGIFPEGAFQLICGSVGDSFEHLTGQDLVTFTGSASTGQKLKSASGDHPQQRALHDGSGLAELLDPGAGCGARHAGVRSVREGSGQGNDHQVRPEVHRNPPCLRAACADRCSQRRLEGASRQGRCRRSRRSKA